jgi:hypothetical protein
MKLVKNFVFAVLLVSTFSFTTFAGDIETPGYVPPSPPRLSVANDSSNTPVVGIDTQQDGVETSDYLLFEALMALLSVY